MHSWRFAAIGTRWEIETAEPLDDRTRTRVQERISAFDSVWSRFRSDSVVGALRRGGSAALSEADAADATAMLGLYLQLGRATAGAVTPLVGAGMEALGYDAQLTLRGGSPRPAPDAWERVVRWNDETLSVRSGQGGTAEPCSDVVIDVGAVGKGRLVDLVAEALEGVPGRVTIDASGDLRVRGGAARVALEHPYDPSLAIGVVEVADAALCASAVTRRAWGSGLHHVLDGRTGVPVRTWAATWVLATEAMRADAAATALFFDGGRELVDEWALDWARMSTDGRVEHSSGFPGELFTAAPRTSRYERVEK